MPLTDTLITTETPAPPKLIVYAPPGVGKTTFAKSAGAILIDCENGAGAIPGLTRTPYLQTWMEMRQWLQEFATKSPGRPVAVDTADWMIQRIAEHVVLDMTKTPKGEINMTSTLGSAHGGYFKARDVVRNIVYRELLPMFNAISNTVPIILLAHAVNQKSTTPEGFEVRQASPDFPDWISAPFIEWADCVFYAQRNGAARTVMTEGNNLILAKNRYALPPELPLDWPAIIQAISNNTKKEK